MKERLPGPKFQLDDSISDGLTSDIRSASAQIEEAWAAHSMNPDRAAVQLRRAGQTLDRVKAWLDRSEGDGKQFLDADYYRAVGRYEFVRAAMGEPENK